jgi:hypothetical protein
MKLKFILAAAIFALSSWVHAAIGTIDVVPAATLLFPHFEVDTTTSNRVSTVITIQNASATAVLANVVLWTDYGIPTRRFSVYLTGYDQEIIDLSDVFNRNFTPRTATAGQDPTNTISPKGPLSQDINFASCRDLLPIPAKHPSIILPGNVARVIIPTISRAVISPLIPLPIAPGVGLGTPDTLAQALVAMSRTKMLCWVTM